MQVAGLTTMKTKNKLIRQGPPKSSHKNVRVGTGYAKNGCSGERFANNPYLGGALQSAMSR
jgi:hypothetical protein